MDFRKTLSALFIDLPFRLRLGIVVLSYLLCLALFARVFLASHNGSILAIPLALSSWMLKWRGALIGLGCTMLALIVFNSLSTGGIVWPSLWYNETNIGGRRFARLGENPWPFNTMNHSRE